MNLDNVIVGDIEADGLLDTITKIHVLSWAEKKNGGWFINSTNDMEIIKQKFSDENTTIVMHNGRRYDGPAIEKVLGIKIKATIIDSLALSWWAYPARVKKFGLEEFGEDYGVPKPKIDDWVNLSYEEYKYRCEEDVKINTRLWVDILKKFRKLYSTDKDIERLINILNFIMDCSYNQEVQKVSVDVKLTESNLDKFEKLKQEKRDILKNAMPKNIKKGIKKKPNCYKKDGSLSVAGKKWFDRLAYLNLPKNTEEFEDIISEQEPNPGSPDQIKKWLYSLGWVPETFEYKRNKETGEVKVIPQLVVKDTKELCKSVKKLIAVEPAIEALDSLSILTHRIGLLKGFLERRDENDMISQGLARLAVTMRWQHATIVNIPKYTGKGDLRDGNWIRSCLIAEEGTKLVQADLSGIESRTSDHYIFHLNKERIIKTKQPFFDPHTEISVVAGLMTEAEELFYVFNQAVEDLSKAGKPTDHLDYRNFSIYKYSQEAQELFDLPEDKAKAKLQDLKNKRSKGKTTNYSSLYLVGAKTLSRTLDISVPEAQELIDAYWGVHWAVKTVSNKFKTKTIDGEKYIYNPVSKFWYYLRNDKDKFSVINQSTAVFCFNMWVYFVVKRLGYPITQTHDDLMLRVEDNEETISNAMKQIKLAMEDVNKYLKLNVSLDCEVQNGRTFAETH